MTRLVNLRPVTFATLLLLAFSSAAFGQGSVYNGVTTTPPPADPPACVGTQTVLLIQDVIPWFAAIGQNADGADATELIAQGKNWCGIMSNQISTTNLSGFKEIVIAAAQTQAFYNNLFLAGTIHSAISTWVSNGGVLSAHLADHASGPGSGGTWDGDTFVGGVQHTLFGSNDDDIAAASDPLIADGLNCPGGNCGVIVDTGTFTDLDGWGFSDHGYFTGLPAGATVVLTQHGTSNPVTVEYSFGSGKVIATLTTIEFRYVGGFFGGVPQNKKLLANDFAAITQPQTKTVILGGPGTTATLTFNNVTYKITGVNNAAGLQLTVTAFSTPSTTGFLNSFPGEALIPFDSYTAAAGGVDTGVEFQVDCQVSATDTTPCTSFFYVLKTGFTLPAHLSAIGGVDYLVLHGAKCSQLTRTSNVQSIFLAYMATVTDPTDVASSDGPSCFLPTYTPGAPPITSGTASRLTAWGPPVRNDSLNQVQAGANRPLTLMLNDILGNPVTNLSLCNLFTFTPITGNVCPEIPAVPTPWINLTSFGIVCPNGAPINPLTDGTIVSPGNSTLNNNGGGNYEIGYKTQKAWQGSCANVVVTLDSGLKAVPAMVGFQFQ